MTARPNYPWGMHSDRLERLADTFPDVPADNTRLGREIHELAPGANQRYAAHMWRAALKRRIAERKARDAVSE